MAEKMRYNKIIDLLEHGKPVFGHADFCNYSELMRIFRILSISLAHIYLQGIVSSIGEVSQQTRLRV